MRQHALFKLRSLGCCGWIFIALAAPAAAQTPGMRLANPVTYRLKVAISVSGGGQTLNRVKTTCPVPQNWREQQVKLISEQKSLPCKTREQAISGLGTLWVIDCPKIPAGRTLELERIYEVTRSQVICELKGRALQRPQKLTQELRTCLRASPGIEIADRDLRTLAQELNPPQTSAWDFARAAADWVRKNVKYRLGAYRGAKFAHQQRNGDCEDLSALMIALCRISGIPARTVWVEGHAYPEIYLEDAQGTGHWVPVQLHGPEAFGTIRETRPILQKGDQFRDPATRKTVRYLPQQVIAYGGRAQLAVNRSMLPNDRP